MAVINFSVLVKKAWGYDVQITKETFGSLPKPVDKQDTTATVGTIVVGLTPLTNRPVA